MGMKSKYAAIALVPIFSVFVAASAQLALPLPAVSLTLQTFAVALSGYFLGARRATLSVLIYLILGAIGAPVFSHFSGGVGVLLNVGGGFLIGFLPLGIFTGLSKKAQTKVLRTFFSAAGLLLCHIFGVMWCSIFSGVSVWAAFLTSSLPFILKDALSLYLAFFVAKRLEQVVK